MRNLIVVLMGGLSGERKISFLLKGKLGVIKENAFADLLIIKGDPLKDLSIFIESEKNIMLLIKDGEIKSSTFN